MKSTREQVQDYELKNRMRSMVDDDSIYDFMVIMGGRQFIRGFLAGTMMSWVTIVLVKIIGG